MGPKLRSHTPLHLLLLVRGAQSVSERRGAHTRACPGAVFRSARQFLGRPGSISPFLSASSHESTWLEYKTYRCTSLPPTKHVHSGHGPVDLTETPWPGFLPRFLIVRHSLVVLIKDVIFVELEKGLDLCHHPSQRNIGFALIRISSTDILMYAREPILDTLCQSGDSDSERRQQIPVLDWLRCCVASPTHLAENKLRYSQVP